MTRDTKVGIVVSCSFLCLVGVVLLNKLKQPDGQGEQTNPPGQARKENILEVEKKAQEKQVPESRVPHEAPKEVAFATPVESTAGPDPKSLLEEKPPPTAPSPSPSDLAETKPLAVSEPAVPEVLVTSPETPTKKKSGDDKPVAVANGDGKKSPSRSNPTVVEVPSPEVALPPTSAVPAPPSDGKEKDPPDSPEKRSDEKKTEVPAPTVAPVPVPVPPTAPTVEPVVPKPEVESKPATPASETTDVVKPVPVVIEGSTNVGEETPKKSGDTVGIEKSERVLPPPSVAGVPQPPSPADVKSIDGGPPLAKEGRLVPLPASDVGKPEPTSPGEPTRVVPEPSREDASIAPVVAHTDAPRPAVGGPPIVESFSEEEYTVQTGDTFATVSKKKYLSEKYAEALATYNRTDSLLGDPGKDLRAGQVISVPDLRILEKRYGNLIPGARPGVAAVPDPAEKKIVPVSAVVPSGGEREPSSVTYRVSPRGQTMREIARLTLGDGERWGEIYRLNRQHRPDFAVPGETVLQLPADARIEARIDERR